MLATIFRGPSFLYQMLQHTLLQHFRISGVALQFFLSWQEQFACYA